MSTTTITASANSSASVNSTTVNNQKTAVELASAIWRITKNQKGRTNAEVFSLLALTLFFYRFLSENLTFYINRMERKIDPAFEYTKLTEQVAEYGREITKIEKGFYILPNQLFSSVLARAKNEPDLARTINQIFDDIAYNFRLFYFVFYPGATDFIREDFYREEEPEVLKLFDTVRKYPSKYMQKLSSTVKGRNKKLIRMMEAVASIPIDNLVEETNGNYINKIIEISELVHTELEKFLIIYFFKRYR
jgi:type I restriction enzyme M protein